MTAPAQTPPAGPAAPDGPATPTPERSAQAREQEQAAPPAQPAGGESALVLDDLLVEDVSIDGMCGVY